jgi:hypothetical protein
MMKMLFASRTQVYVPVPLSQLALQQMTRITDHVGDHLCIFVATMVLEEPSKSAVVLQRHGQGCRTVCIIVQHRM